jgi:hypothetical protein
MNKHQKIYCLTALSVLTLVACQRSGNEIVASVGKDKITASELAEEMKIEQSKFDPAAISTEADFVPSRHKPVKR